MTISLFTKSSKAITIFRQSPGDTTFVRGYARQPPPEVIEGKTAIIQPTLFKDLIKLPEGDENKDQKTFWSQEVTFQVNDRVKINATGEQFLVMKLGDWDGFNLTPDHSEAFGVSLDNQDE